MTLEEIKEAVEIIKAYRQRLTDSVSTLLDGDIKAFDIAIEAMERESCDAISRQAVLDKTWEEPSYTDPLNVLTEIRDKVKALPSVTPQEPKTGHWIDNHNNTISCDHCHTWFKKDDRYGYMHYCPYCNTRMVEPQERSGEV